MNINTRKRGLSKQKLCMAVGIGARREPVAVVCGHGRPSAARIRAAPGGHVAEGATLVHDRERAHNVLVRENGLADESYKADARGAGDRERVGVGYSTQARETHL